MMEFITSPNQRRITIHKTDQPQGYTKVNPRVCKQAMATLGYSAFMLYMYFCMNATNFQLILPTAALCTETGLTRNTYYAAFNELVHKGYLVCKPGSQCLFDFYENPELRKQSKNSAQKQMRRTRKQETSSQYSGENMLNIKNRGRAEALTTETDESPSGPDVRRTLSETTETKTTSRIFVDI